MKELNDKELRKLQKIELEILIEFDRICKKHNIKYFLCGGTLIGAVRHKGFIPWDDDIDVSMVRNEYDKFLKIVDEELNKDKFYLQSMETDDNYGFPIAKLKRKNSLYVECSSSRNKNEQNIWIDIFPLDNIKNNRFLSKLYYFKIYALKIILAYKDGFVNKVTIKKNKKFLTIVKFLSIFYNRDRLFKRLQRLMKRYNNIKTDYIASFAGVYLPKEIFKRELIEGTIEKEFEGLKFSIPKNYDKYLRHYYGDYMTLPPEDQRKGHHYTDCLKFPEE